MLPNAIPVPSRKLPTTPTPSLHRIATAFDTPPSLQSSPTPCRAVPRRRPDLSEWRAEEERSRSGRRSGNPRESRRRLPPLPRRGTPNAAVPHSRRW
ncbi:hypothetical protein EUGRSUZ_I00439 [Eucalyptus grandis]|uniref:Uncharacterized protein n=2 Tax=Eucalyptus grandis TaxID=71139 RepID=A0ACC3JDU7_EUCGR|nr:hypothetical protein EUGRSUZ_I00439 [Eucalyptus grandis]